MNHLQSIKKRVENLCSILKSSILKLKSKILKLTPFPRVAVSLIGTIIILLIIFYKPSVVEAGWWDDTWHYRKGIGITNSGSAQTDFQVEILSNFDMSADVTAGKVQSDFDDLRFTDINGKPLPYWIEDDTSSSLNVWAEIPSIPASGATVYMYYGNPSASAGSDPINIIGTSANPGTSCVNIINNRDTADGTYYIETDDFSAFQVYCDMTTDDGGWTMVGHYRNPAYTNAPADHDNRDYAYFMKARNNNYYGKAEYLASPNSAGPWTDWRVLQNVGWPIEFAVLLDMNDSFTTGWETATKKAIYSVINRNTMPNYGTTQDLTTGNNVNYKLNTGDGWTDVGSSSASGIHYWYPRNSGNSYLTLFHVSNYYYIDGRPPTNYHYCNYLGIGLSGGNNSWYHTGHLLIRESTPSSYSLSVSSPGSEVKGESPIAYWSFDEGYGTTVHNQMEKNGESGLVGWWKFDEGAGTTLGDEMGINDGTITGASWSTSGKTGNALDFDGVDHVVVSSPQFDVLDKEITISVWQYGDVTLQPQADSLLEGRDSSNNRIFNVHLPWSSGIVYWDAGNSGSSYDRTYKTAGSASEYEGQWNHWVFTKNANTGEMKMYLNGELWHSDTGKTYSFGTVSQFTIGASYSETNNYDGLIDNLKIYNRELSAGEVEAEYNSLHGHIVPETTVEKYYSTSYDGLVRGIVSTNYGTARATSAYHWYLGVNSYVGQYYTAPNYYVYRSYLEFNTSAIPDSALIHDAVLYLQRDVDNSDTDFDVNINKFNWVAPITTGNREATYDAVGAVFDQVWQNSGDVTDDVYYPSPSLDTSWINKTGSTKYQIRSSRETAATTPTGKEHIRISQAEKPGTDNDPYLQVSYYAPHIVGWVDGAQPDSNKSPMGKAFSFDGIDDYVDVSTAKIVQDVQSISLWINPDSTTESIIDLDGGTHYVHVSSGTITATGFTSPIIYVNGTVSSTVSASNWSHVVITTATAFDADDITIGKRSTNYYDGEIDELKLYDFALSADQVKVQYNRGVATSLNSGQVANPGSGPVGFWKMDEGSSYTAFDSSGNENHGELKNMDPSTDWVPAKIGKGLDFDGSNDYVDIPTLTLGTSDWTVSAWYKADDFDQYTHIFTADTQTNFAFKIGSSGWYTTPYFYSTITGSVYDTSYTLNTNEWYYLTCLRSGNTIKLYLDGQLITTGDATGLNIAATGFNIGTGNSEYSDGQIDHVKIYDYARTVDQIHQDMGGSPIAYWKFDEGYGTTAYDSQNDNDGTLTNMASDDWVDGAVPSASQSPTGRALSFNGTDAYVRKTDLSGDLSESFTMSAWVQSADFTPSQYFMEINYGKPVIASVNNKISVSLRDQGDTTWNNYESTNAVLTDNQWNFVTVTYASDDTLIIYHNGVEAYSGSHTGSIGGYPASPIFDVGGRSTVWFNGEIDEVKVWNYALTAGEIKVEYNRGAALSLGAGQNDSDPGSSNLVGWWKMDEASGTTAYDISGSGGNGTLTNMDASTDWVQGKIGKGLDFDGSDDYVTVPDSTGTDPTSAWTLSAWIKRDAMGVQHPIIEKYDWSAGKGNYIMRIGSDNKLIAHVINGTSYHSCGTTSSTINSGDWYHVTATFNSSTDTLICYINGIAEATNTSATINPPGSDTAMKIGARGNDSGTTFNGIIDNAKIYKTALSQAEVAWEYNQGAPIAHWRFDEGSGITAYDESVHDNDGTLTSMDPANDWVSGKFNGALDFDGNDDHITTIDADYFTFGNGSADTAFSISAWVYIDSSVTDFRTLISKFDSSTAPHKREWNLRIHDGGQKLRLTLFDESTDVSINTETDGNLVTNEWIYLTVVYDGSAHPSGINIYQNGLLVPSTDTDNVSYVAMENLAEPVVIGALNNYSQTWQGKIDNIKIYNYALTADQVKADYNSGAVRFAE